LSTQILPPTTAGIHPEQFPDDLSFAKSRRSCVFILVIFLLIGFGLRVYHLGTESLGEDEFNKLETVQEYRTRGLSGKNGEHPFLMKGLQTVSVIAADKINSAFSFSISEEAALRFPVALLGTLTVLLIFLFVSELFGRGIGLISAALWAVEPMAIGFDRVAKEDSLVLFFFLLCALFLVKSQTKAEHRAATWIRYFWGSAASFAALMASKYNPFYLSIIGGYYNTFLNLPNKKWNVGGRRWIIFFVIMGITFLILNPTILLPDTWREMLKFSSESRIGHDSYEFMGTLYPHKFTDWLNGVPWTFYFVFIAVKSSLLILIFFAIGLPLMLRRRMGDGRFFVILWAFLWFVPFTVMGGKFTRYFTFAEPLILITSAVGFYFSVRWLSEKLTVGSRIAVFSQAALFALFLAAPLTNALSATPHFRLFTNSLGGGGKAAGSYFPHDEFYDLSTRDIIQAIEPLAIDGAIVGCEAPELFDYYDAKNKGKDLTFVSLSDRSAVAKLRTGDFIVSTSGRRYFSNSAYEEYLSDNSVPVGEIKVAGVTSARIYRLDESSLTSIQAIAGK